MGFPSWPYIFTGTLAVWMIGVWAVAQTTHARALCEQTGFPQPPNDDLNVFFYLFANKEGVIGLIFAVLQLAREWRAMGISLLCMCICGAGDAYLSMEMGSMGLWEAFQAHGIVTLLAAWAAIRIIQEN